MGKQRKRFDVALKVRVALDAIRGTGTLNEISSQYRVHPNQVSKWKKEAIDGLKDVFSKGVKHRGRDESQLRSELYQQIGQLKVELDWVKKKSGLYD